MVSGKDPESSLLPIPSPPPKAVFVLGTDTNVGKTLVSSSIVGICLGMEMAVSYFKPAQTGVSSPDDPAGDAGLVLSQNRPHHFRAMTGYCFPDPIDPMTAAERVGALISRTDLLQKFHSLYREADMTVIEGAGGVCSPFFPDGEGLLSVIKEVKWPFHTILVSHPHIGTLSQTLLAVQYLRSRLTGTLSLVLVPRPIPDPNPLASLLNPGTFCRIFPEIDVFVWENKRFSLVSGSREE